MLCSNAQWIVISLYKHFQSQKFFAAAVVVGVQFFFVLAKKCSLLCWHVRVAGIEKNHNKVKHVHNSMSKNFTQLFNLFDTLFFSFV